MGNTTINNIITIIGVPTIAGALIYIGIKLHTLETIKETVEKIKSNVKVIGDCLFDAKGIKLNPADIQSYSPLSLTDDEKEKIKLVGFDSIMENNESDFFNFIDEEKPKTKYDVQTSSIKSIIALLDKEYFNSVKTHLYENPNEDIKTLISTLGVYLRDMYLSKHLSIDK